MVNAKLAINSRYIEMHYGVRLASADDHIKHQNF